MEKKPYVVGLVLTLLASPAFALDEESFQVKTTKDLAKLCSVKDGERYFEFSRGFCLGYIDGGWDYHQALTNGPDFKPLACPKPTVTRDQALKVFLDWTRANPDVLGETPVQGVMRAISQKWPCPGK